jgi:hypothetical protein
VRPLIACEQSLRALSDSVDQIAGRYLQYPKCAMATVIIDVRKIGHSQSRLDLGDRSHINTVSNCSHQENRRRRKKSLVPQIQHDYFGKSLGCRFQQDCMVEFLPPSLRLDCDKWWKLGQSVELLR